MTTGLTGPRTAQPKGRANGSRPQSVIVSTSQVDGEYAELPGDDLPASMNGEVLVEEREPDRKARSDRRGNGDRAKDSTPQDESKYHRQFLEWYTYAGELKQKYDELLAERDHVAREARKLNEQLEKLQIDALNSDSIDRFQPDTDSIIQNAFDGVVVAVRECVNTLCVKSKAKPSLSENDWEAEVTAAMYDRSFDTQSGRIDYKNTRIRRMAVKNVIWHFLKVNIFNEDFPGYFGPGVMRVREAYRLLYPAPRLDKQSAKWRTMSVTKLAELQDQKDVDAGVDALYTKFLVDVTARLGYDKIDEKLVDKIRSVMLRATSFGQKLAQQRAMFELIFPDVKSAELMKVDGDQHLTNLEDDDGNCEERSGKVWFVSRPALVKWGNGMGDKLDVSMTAVRANVKLAEG